MTDDQHRLRAGKVEALRAGGVDPYPVRFERSATAAELHARHAGLAPSSNTGERAAVAGRLMSLRRMGKLTFAVLDDWSGRIQLFVDRRTLGEHTAAFNDLDLGDWVGASGEVVTTRTGELSVRVEEFILLAKSLHPLPEKWHGLHDVETRYRRRYLDLIANEEARRILGLRAATVRSLRRSFEERGFIEVETPMLQIRPGGALARPFVTHHNALGMDMYLRIAPELYLKRLVVGGVERVFEINRNFRNEGVSPRHNPEFTMLEAYQAMADYHDMMTLTEEVVSEAARAVLGTTRLTYQGREVDLTPPWRRLGYLEALNEATGSEFAMDMPVEEARRRAAALGVEVLGNAGVGKIVSLVFEHHVEHDLWGPVIVTDYPEEISPLARRHRSGPGLTERFEVILAGWEIANAFSELNDPVDQRRRFEAQAAARAEGDEEAHPVDDDYVLALEYGLPPTGGLGLGVDRLVMVLADAASIREVILFPHLRPDDGGAG